MTPGEWPQQPMVYPIVKLILAFSWENELGQSQDTTVLHFLNTWLLLTEESESRVRLFIHFVGNGQRPMRESGLLTTYFRPILEGSTFFPYSIFLLRHPIISSYPHLDCNDTKVLSLNKHIYF